MPRLANRLVVPVAAALLAAACGANAGYAGQDTVSCFVLCGAEAECVGGDAAYRERCIEECSQMTHLCRMEIGPGCLACWEACEDNCRELACTCDLDGQPGDRCEADADCAPGSICYERLYCVGDGPLRLSLSFDADSDFDIHLRTPGGREINFATDQADGGVLDVDQCVSVCGEGGHVENIVFRETAPAGEYEVWVVNFNGRSAGDFRVEIAKADGDEYFRDSLPARARAESRHYRFTVFDLQP